MELGRDKDGNDCHPRKTPPGLTTSEIAPMFSGSVIAKVDAFRREFELIHGPTPIQAYSSMLPQHIQDWQLEHDPQSYFDHLAPFMAAYLTVTAQAFASQGRLDDLSDPVIQVFLRNRGKLKSLR